jgi:hypothetical protein
MTDDRFRSVWLVPATPDGFVWVTRYLLRDYRASQVLGRRTDIPDRSYQPLQDEPCLYLKFADLEPTPDNVLAFANCFGRLGSRASMATISPKDAEERGLPPLPPDDPGRPVHSYHLQMMEPLAIWQGHVYWLRHLIRLWDLVADGAEDALRPWIIWKGRGAPLFRLPTEVRRALILDASHLPAPRGQPLRPGDNIAAARAFVLSEVNKHLGGSASPSVSQDRDGTPFLETRTTGLLEAMYLQFAWALCGQKRCRRCQGCGTWFELAPGVNRADRLTCSVSCRVRVSRERRDRARELRAQGKSVGEIAQEIGSTVSKVKQWIRSTKE